MSNQDPKKFCPPKDSCGCPNQYINVNDCTNDYTSISDRLTPNKLSSFKFVSYDDGKRYKIPENEKKRIKDSFSNGIPIQRLKDIIDNYKYEFDDDFIEKLESLYNNMIINNLVLKNNYAIGDLILGFRSMFYNDNAISKSSVRKIELLTGRTLSVVQYEYERPKKLVSGRRVQISDEGVELIKNKLKSNIPLQRLANIIENYDSNDDFLQTIKQINEDAISSNLEYVKIINPVLYKLITNYRGITRNNGATSEENLNRIQILVGEENPIPYTIKYGREKEIILKKDEDTAEFIGTFIMAGYINQSDIRIQLGKDANPIYVSHLKALFEALFNKSPTITEKSIFQITSLSIVHSLETVGFSIENRRAPSWIFTSSDDNLVEDDQHSIILACLRGMINAGGFIGAHNNKIEILLTKTEKGVLEDFKNLCLCLNIHTNDIIDVIRKNGDLKYSVSIPKGEVKKFLIDIIRPLKWDFVRDEIDITLRQKGTSIDKLFAESFSDLKALQLKNLNEEEFFQYDIIRISNIKNLILRKCLYDYIEDVSNYCNPLGVFQGKTLIRASDLRFIGIRKDGINEEVKSDIIKAYFLDNLLYKEYFFNDLPTCPYKELLDLVNQVYDEFDIDFFGVEPNHIPILKKIMIRHPNSILTEVPTWKELYNNLYAVGLIDLILVIDDSLIIADLKKDDNDMIKSLPQIMAYTLMFENIIFKNCTNFNAFNLKCIVFTRNKIWEFELKSLKTHIIKFIKYYNSIRENRLMTLSRPIRRDLQKDIETILKSFK